MDSKKTFTSVVLICLTCIVKPLNAQDSGPALDLDSVPSAKKGNPAVALEKGTIPVRPAVIVLNPGSPEPSAIKKSETEKIQTEKSVD